jgi:hypothetical protein
MVPWAVGPRVDSPLNSHRGKILTALSHRLNLNPRVWHSNFQIGPLDINSWIWNVYKINKVNFFFGLVIKIFCPLVIFSLNKDILDNYSNS